MQPLRSLRILLAEDNPVNQRLVQAVLEERGHTLVPAATGRDGDFSAEAEQAWQELVAELARLDRAPAEASQRAGAEGRRLLIDHSPTQIEMRAIVFHLSG